LLAQHRSPELVRLLAFDHGLAWFVMIILAYLPTALLLGVSPLRDHKSSISPGHAGGLRTASRGL